MKLKKIEMLILLYQRQFMHVEPTESKKEKKYGYLEPFVPFETFGDPKTLNCDRDSGMYILQI